MVATFLRWKLGARLFGDPVPKDGLLALEFTGFVVGINPVGDLVGVSSLEIVNSQYMTVIWSCKDILQPSCVC